MKKKISIGKDHLIVKACEDIDANYSYKQMSNVFQDFAKNNLANISVTEEGILMVRKGINYKEANICLYVSEKLIYPLDVDVEDE